MSAAFSRLGRWMMGGLAVALVLVLLTLAVQPVRTQEAETHSLIAYDSSRGIVIMNPDGSNQRELGLAGGEPQWSPDGLKIVNASSEPSEFGDTFSQLYLFDVNGNKHFPITDLPGDKMYPRWSPDGNWIAFTNSEAGIPQREIYLVRPDGSQLTRVTNTLDADEYLLNWTPDGQHLLIKLVQGRESGVYLINLDGTGLTPQPAFPPRTDYAVWSPDAQRIAIGFMKRIKARSIL